MIYVWLTVLIGTLILEMGHPGLFLFLSFSIGAAAAAGGTLYGLSVVGQISTFIVVTAISIILLRQCARTLHNEEVATNMHALIGKSGMVTKTIVPPAPGQVKINGEIWTARSLDAHRVEAYTQVVVVRVVGSHVVVKAHTHS